MAKRAPEQRTSRKAAALSLRITPALRERLDGAASKSGRPLSEEIQSRLDQSFAREDALAGPNKRLFEGINQVGKAMEQRTGEPWSGNAWLSEQMGKAVSELIAGMNANASLKKPDVGNLPGGMDKEHFGQWLAQTFLMFGKLP